MLVCVCVMLLHLKGYRMRVCVYILEISLRLHCVINREYENTYVCFTGKEQLTSA